MSKVVRIDWLDTTSDEGQQSIKDAVKGEPTLCLTFGVLLEANNNKVVVASTCVGKDDVRDAVTFLRSSVVKITELGEVE